MNVLTKIFRAAALASAVITLAACSFFQTRETCEDCTARCVNEQKISPDICRRAACGSICPVP